MKLIQKIRKNKKMTQNEFSSKLGICQAALSKIETGKFKMDRDAMIGLYKVFKVEPKEIFRAAIKGE